MTYAAPDLICGSIWTIMIYDGRAASKKLENSLRLRVTALPRTPRLAIISVAEHPSITSFIKIKRRYAESVGVEIKEYKFQEEISEDTLVLEIEKIVAAREHDGVIVQLPLPPHYNTRRVLDAVPLSLDVDVLGTAAVESFTKNNFPLPTVVGAIAHILQDTATEISNKEIAVIGQGKLVGLPVTTWLSNQRIEPKIIDIDTDPMQRTAILKSADIVISGSGTPHLLKPADLKEGVVLIDAGTSEQSGVVVGDCDPSCADIASVITLTPGGVGPLTVAFLFQNLISAIERPIP
jgi:methylenetetrahydrofolate dehydrogenase (NADP+)/methenyltetrahydrofolate cyclohydrolase